jgi:hypothetical protein
LYAVEREMAPLLPPTDEETADARRRQREDQRRVRRQQRAGPVLTELKAWRDEQRPGVLPKSALGEAVG